jgi:DNA invertase Pin-like site-specific DNA recombinase
VTPKNAILLLRISYDKAGDAHGVALQEKNGHAHATRIGWGIGRVIIENDTSAFKRKRIKLPDGRTELRTVRPGFRLALDLLAAGTHDGMLAIDLDRACRDPRDLEDLIDVIETSRPRIPVDSVTGSLRLNNDADVTMARVMVAIANKASRDTRRRISDHQQELALQGKFSGGGRRPYGYAADRVTVVEHEAEVIRWMAGRILDTQEYWSLGRVAKDLEARGIPTASGLSHWQARSVATILTGPRVAGYRVYKKEIVGDASWPAILDRPVWEAVCAELSRRDNGGGANQLKRWLTGVLICGAEGCGKKLVGAQGHGGKRYWCSTTKGGCGRISIRALYAEDEIADQILEYIGDPRMQGRIQGALRNVDAMQVRKEIGEDEAQLRELAGMWARRELSLIEYREARGVIHERIERARLTLMSSTPKALRRLVESGDPRAEWDGFSPAARRDVVLSVVSGYRVMPHPASRARRFDPDRLVPIPHPRETGSAL